MLPTNRSVFLLCLLAPALANAQSFTTSLLNLRNATGQAITLANPLTTLSPYRIDLPPAPGTDGQVLRVTAIAGSTVRTEWSDATFWGLTGSNIVSAGTGPGQSYIGTENAQDVVVATAATERLRIVGVAGPTVGYVGIGTATPASVLDVRGTITLSSSGPASGIVFAEPSPDGSNTTTIRAKAQAANVEYTLPAQAPTTDGMVLSSTTTGDMAWTQPVASIGRGLFQPVSGSYVHVINTGAYDVRPGDVAVVSVLSTPGTTIATTITGIDATANTITVETSLPVADTDRISWIVMPQ
jgi:hypothetical protein